MPKVDTLDIEVIIDGLYDKLSKRIDDMSKYVIDSLYHQNQTTQMACDKDYQRDTYHMIKELKFVLEQDRIEKELEKMREEHKYLGKKIQDLEMTKILRESEYFRSN